MASGRFRHMTMNTLIFFCLLSYDEISRSNMICTNFQYWWPNRVKIVNHLARRYSARETQTGTRDCDSFEAVSHSIFIIYETWLYFFCSIETNSFQYRFVAITQPNRRNKRTNDERLTESQSQFSQTIKLIQYYMVWNSIYTVQHNNSSWNIIWNVAVFVCGLVCFVCFSCFGLISISARYVLLWVLKSVWNIWR